MSDEPTLPDNKLIFEMLTEVSDNLKDLAKQVDKIDQTTDAQFEAIRQGIAENNAEFDRIESKILDNRSTMLKVRADLKELSERVRLSDLKSRTRRRTKTSFRGKRDLTTKK